MEASHVRQATKQQDYLHFEYMTETQKSFFLHECQVLMLSFL